MSGSTWNGALISAGARYVDHATDPSSVRRPTTRLTSVTAKMSWWKSNLSREYDEAAVVALRRGESCKHKAGGRRGGVAVNAEVWRLVTLQSGNNTTGNHATGNHATGNYAPGVIVAIAAGVAATGAATADQTNRPVDQAGDLELDPGDQRAHHRNTARCAGPRLVVILERNSERVARRKGVGGEGGRGG